MEISTVMSRARRGIEAPLVRVETHISNGLPGFTLVGLPETAVRESRERVRSAILNSHLAFPDRRITITLSPADLPKEGGRFDLPIALGILAASGQLPADSLAGREFLGELALDGALRPVPGVICAARQACAAAHTLHLPASSAPRAALVPGARIIASSNLLELCAHLTGRAPQTPLRAPGPGPCADYPDLQDVVGQQTARRALEIAAAGAHNLLLYGPPGTGKTLLAERLPGILPTPTLDEVLPSLALSDLACGECFDGALRRPFRNPHHSATAAALIGGGSNPRPGEVSLAHGGVLFLDELPEFPRAVLDMLRQPLETGTVTLSRARHKVTFPARFQLVAAMNPCPCGFDGDDTRPCRCTPDQLRRYRTRVSGPLLDRIDLHVPVRRIPLAELHGAAATESSAAVQERVSRARARQRGRQGDCNASLEHTRLVSTSLFEKPALQYLERAADRLSLSVRAYHRTLRVALTIADLAALPKAGLEQVAEALAYREPQGDSGS
jgi:magnesium chelatase family protein